MILGRADLRTGVSEAKFDAGAEFEVRLAVAPQKPPEKLIFRSENVHRKKQIGATFFSHLAIV